MKLIILNRTPEKARKLADETGHIWGSLSEESLELLEEGVDLAVQTTTVGMHPFTDADPIPWWTPRHCSLVYDMIYNPRETVFLSRSRKAGIRTVNGLEMLEGQARLQFELFTGVPAPD
jgi:shikimate 5-dehydrogenase